MKKIRIIALFSFILIFCTPKNNSLRNVITIEEDNEHLIKLDSESSFELLSIQILKEENLLLTMDAIKNNINIFDFDKGEVVSKIPININEKNRILNPTRFYYHNQDSIFIIDFGSNIKLINNKGIIKNSFNIGEIKSKKGEYDGIYGYLPISNNKNFIFKDARIFYPTEHIIGSEGRLGIFNIKSSKIKEVIKQPYEINNLFESDITDFWYDFDTFSNSIYISFPLANSIYQYNLEDSILIKLNGSNIDHNFKDHYNPIFNDLRYSNIEPERISNILDSHKLLNRYTSIISTDSFIARIYIHKDEKSFTKARGFTIYIFSKSGEILGERYFKNPTKEGDILLVSNMEDFIFSKNDNLFIPFLKSNQDENILSIKSFSITNLHDN
jgi:hypothetical protein